MPNLHKNASLFLSQLLAGSLRRLPRDDLEWVARTIGRARTKAGAEELALFGRCLSQEHYGITNSLEHNGESWLLEMTSRLGFDTLFDVGANVGDWTRRAAPLHPAAKIHCFEIVPGTYSALRTALADLDDRVILNNFGLGRGDSAVDLFVSPTDNLISSIYSFDAAAARQRIEGHIRDAMTYVDSHRIKKIDLLKLDVEGAESLVVKGLLPLIENGGIRISQFEYNRGALQSRFLLRDFYDLFEPRGYVLGKLTPEGVNFRPYDWDLEDFYGPNYVAVRRDDTEVVELLRRKS
jgi:FkbM family methyltransferase